MRTKRVSEWEAKPLAENTEENINYRDKILFGEKFMPERYLGGIRRFEGITVDELRKLYDAGLLDVNESYNDAPSVGEFVQFMETHESCTPTAHGYAVSPARHDCRISIEGLETQCCYDVDTILDFVHNFRYADEFVADTENGCLYCWYD